VSRSWFHPAKLRSTGVSLQPGSLNASNRRRFIVVRRIAGNPDRPDYRTPCITNENAAGYRYEITSGQPIDRFHEIGLLLRTGIDRTRTDPERESAMRFSGGHVRAKEAGAILTIHRYTMAACIEDGDGEGFESEFGTLGESGLDDGAGLGEGEERSCIRHEAVSLWNSGPIGNWNRRRSRILTVREPEAAKRDYMCSSANISLMIVSHRYFGMTAS